MSAELAQIDWLDWPGLFPPTSHPRVQEYRGVDTLGARRKCVCAMDPTREHGHEHHDEQGAEGWGVNAAAPSTTTSTTSLLGEERGVVQELTEAMAAARVAELRPTPDPGLGLGPGPGPGPDADLEADEQRQQPQPPKAPPATMTGAAGATTGSSTATTAMNDHGGAAALPSVPGPGFSFGSTSSTDKASIKVCARRGTQSIYTRAPMP